MVDTRDADIKAIKDADAAEAKDMAAKAFDKMAGYYADDARCSPRELRLPLGRKRSAV